MLGIKTRAKETVFRFINRISQTYPTQGVPIILYHRIGPVEYCNLPVTCITVEKFEEQVRYLSDAGYYFASMNEVVNYVQGKATLPMKCVALTFDDGYADNYVHAFPILKQYAAKGTIFINTAFIGREVALKVGLNKFAEISEENADVVYRFLSWDQIKEMYQGGIDFQPHGHTHRDLLRSSETVVREEVTKSKKVLEVALGERRDFFSYPFGRYNETVISILKECGFNAALAVEPGLAKPGVDAYTLPRTCIDSNVSLARFRATLTGYMRYYAHFSKGTRWGRR